ncbi:hypothetical protein J6590_036407 [Homalodisca vitripennis]|nr:hypothetical protein J6590_036407 [Homalodisca vitripennis]
MHKFLIDNVTNSLSIRGSKDTHPINILVESNIHALYNSPNTLLLYEHVTLPVETCGRMEQKSVKVQVVKSSTGCWTKRRQNRSAVKMWKDGTEECNGAGCKVIDWVLDLDKTEEVGCQDVEGWNRRV